MTETPPPTSGVSEWWKGFGRTILVVGILLCAGAVGFKHWLLTPPKVVVAADAGFKTAKQTIDPEKFRAWALSEMTKHPGAGVIIPNAELPDYIQNLYSEPPEEVSTMSGNIMITWGGGFFHWGFDIGPTNFTLTPNSDIPFAIAEWVPGIYYSREATRYKIQ